jgi:hypothetical protein
MSSRVEKSRAKSKSKSEQRARLAASIDLVGLVVEMPCSWCFEKKLDCKMMEGVTRCAECVRRGRSCDGLGVPFDARTCPSPFLCFALVLTCLLVEKVLAESRRLDREEDEATEILSHTQSRLGVLRSELADLEGQSSASVARLARIRKQRRLLVSKGAKMVNRGIANLDLLEEEEDREHHVHSSSWAAPPPSSPGDSLAAFGLDLSGAGVLDGFVEVDRLMADQGFVGGTVGAPVGSSGGVS